MGKRSTKTKAGEGLDAFWKEALEAYFKDFMQLFLPDAHADIDWSHPVAWKDKELQKLRPDNKKGKRFVDKLVEVRRRGGTRALVLVHIEVQSSKDMAFPERMFTYHYRLRDRYDCPVFSCAVLADTDPAWRPDAFEDGLWRCRLRMDFPVVKLLDWQGRRKELNADNNQMGLLAEALLTVQATSDNVQARYRWKLEAVLSLYEKGYTRGEVRRLFHFIDWAVQLPEELALELEYTLTATEAEKIMPYITSIERNGIKKGLEKGRLETTQENIIDVLEVRFGSVSDEVRSRVGQLTDVQTCKSLLRQAISASTLEEFASQLEAC